jgi:GET complex subunit GET2
MKQLLRGSTEGPQPDPRFPGAARFSADLPSGAGQQQEVDPMMNLLQQMMGMPPPEAGASTGIGNEGLGAPNGLPPGLAAMLGSMPGQASQAQDQPPTGAYVWKIVHAVFALALGAYILYTYTFSGTLASRLRLPVGGLPAEGSLFWVFITAELGLQGARYLLEGGRVEEGMVKTISGFLPPPWNQRLLLASRYSSIWTTLVADAMVVVWMIGVVAWWRGELV